MRRGLFRTERRASSDFAVRAEVYGKLPRGGGGLSYSYSGRQVVKSLGRGFGGEDVTLFCGLRGDGSSICMDAVLVRAE
jgi:hypothetical protein